MSSSLASLLGDTIASALFTEESVQTLPSCTQTIHLVQATQAQAITTSHSFEPPRAAKCQSQCGAHDPHAAGQQPSVRHAAPAVASAVPLLPPTTSQQQSESVHRQLFEAPRQKASSPSAQDIVAGAPPQLPPSTLDQSIKAQQSDSAQSQLSTVNRQAARSASAHSATDSVMDSVADSVTNSASLGSSASDAAWQHHSCNRASQIGKRGLAGQEDDLQRAGQGTLALAEDGLANRCSAASACNMTSSIAPCSQVSHSCSSSSSSSGGSSITACSDGQAKPAASGSIAPLSSSVGSCKAAQLCANEAEGNKQLPTGVLLACSRQDVPALAASNEPVIVESSAADDALTSTADSSAADDVQTSTADSSAADDVQTSTADSSAPDDVQASPAIAHDASDITAGSSEALQTAYSGAERAESLLSASTFDTEADPAQAGLAAHCTVWAGEGDFKSHGQQEVSVGTSQALMLAEVHARCPSQLVTTSTRVRQAWESAQLRTALTGTGVSVVGMLPKARVQVAATAEMCDVHTELTDTGVQADASMLAGKLQAESKSCCSAPNGDNEVQADTQSAESADSVGSSDSELVSGSTSTHEAARHQSLPDGPAVESAPGISVSKNDLSSCDANAEAPAMHSSRACGTAIIPGEHLCTSDVDANQSDYTCPQTEMQTIGKTDTVQYKSAPTESKTTDSQQNMAMQQARPAMLGLVTACGGHDSLVELIRADMSCFLYEQDRLLMSVVEKITDTLTANST